MQSIKYLTATIAGLGLLFLGACAGDNSASNSANTADKPTETTANSASQKTETHKEEEHAHKSGEAHASSEQVIETGDYHMEFLTHKSGEGINLDVVLENEKSHEPVSSAKVTAQVQLPNGSEKSLDMTYNAAEKAYTATLPSPAPGEYSVAIVSEIDGKKVNGRFSFKQ